MGDKGRVEGHIFPAVLALLGCRRISDVLTKGIATLNNFVAMIIPYKKFLFAGKFDLIVQRLASHKGLNLDHLLNVPLAFVGEFGESQDLTSHQRKASKLTGSCELYPIYFAKITTEFDLQSAMYHFRYLNQRLLD